MSAMPPRRPRPSVHYKYWLFILVLIIIALITEKWSSKENFTSYLSNAATLTSLLLGLVAIFYSFISNDSLSKGLGGITVVSKEIGEAREKIAGYLQQAEESNHSLTSSKDSLDQAKDLIAADLKGLGELLNEVREESRGLIQIVNNIPNRLEKVESGVGDLATLFRTRQAADSPSSMEISSTEDFAREFMARTTPEINLLIIALVLAAQTKRYFTIKELAKVLPGNASSLLGELVLLSSVSLARIRIAGTPVVDTPDIRWPDILLNVVSVPSYFLNEAKNVYQQKLEAKDSEGQDIIDGYRNMLIEIHRLFSV
jgi:hypothetical protein